MKKRAKNTGKMSGRKKLDTVGVAGSIPVEPTILKLPAKHKAFEIPEDFDVVPAIEWVRGRPRLYRILIRKGSKRGDFAVTSRRTKKTG